MGDAELFRAKRWLSEPLMLIVCLVFFVGFALIDGPFFESDSASYYTFNVFREPGYPLFLAFCRLLPGASSFLHDGYAGLYHAVFLQSLVWAFAVWRVGVCVKDIAGRGTVLIHFAVCLLHRFVSQRGALYSNSILTESLAMPLFLFFFVQLFELLWDGAADRVDVRPAVHGHAEKDGAAGHTIRQTLKVAALALLLIILRKHMTVTLLIWGFMAFVLHLLIPKTRNVRRFVVQCALIVCVFLAAQLFTRVYNLAAFGTFSPQAGSHEGMMCMFLYVSDEEDAALFREGEETQKQWFEEIAAAQKAREARFKDVPAGASWHERQMYFNDNYDVIGYEIVHDVLFAEAEKRLGTDAPHAAKVRLMYDLEGELVPILRRQGFADYLKVYADNLLAGLLASTTQIAGVFLPVTLMLLLCYAVLLVRTAGWTRTTLFAGLVIAALFINAGVVAAVIFSQARYDSYLMGMFYTALLLMGFRLHLRQRAGS